MQIYLDSVKAFDGVNHKLLLKKLHRFGICSALLTWFEDYLTDHVQRVTALGVKGPPLPVSSGVRQGSILGPLLFLIYVTEWPSGEVATSVSLFADEKRCFWPMKSLEDGACLQRDLEHINPWCDFCRGVGGTLGISGWGCAAGTLEPITYTRASSTEFCYPTE